MTRRRRTGATWWLGLTLVAVLPGCRSSEPRAVDFSADARRLASEDYQTVRARWTRHARVVTYDGTLIEAWATLKSAEFRSAYVDHFADVYKLPESERSKLRDDQLAQSRVLYELHMAVQSTDFRWVDLDKANSAWKVTLVDGAGNALLPEKIEAPRLPEIYEAEFFPTKTEFTKTYVVRFKAPAEGSDESFAGPSSGLILLRIAGPSAAAEMVWRAQSSHD